MNKNLISLSDRIQQRSSDRLDTELRAASACLRDFPHCDQAVRLSQKEIVLEGRTFTVHNLLNKIEEAAKEHYRDMYHMQEVDAFMARYESEQL